MVTLYRYPLFSLFFTLSIPFTAPVKHNKKESALFTYVFKYLELLRFRDGVEYSIEDDEQFHLVNLSFRYTFFDLAAGFLVNLTVAIERPLATAPSRIRPNSLARKGRRRCRPGSLGKNRHKRYRCRFLLSTSPNLSTRHRT